MDHLQQNAREEVDHAALDGLHFPWHGSAADDDGLQPVVVRSFD
ncbi:hypothetical protein [Lentzea tibetensis]|nr:hypothetical protein [Lentzea tibetensis]